MKTDIRYALSALVLCIGAFLTPATAFAAGGADTTPPRVSAKAADGMLHIEATDDDSGVEAIYISGKRVNYRVDGALDLDFEDFAPDGQETVEVYGIDFAGNQSETVEVKNPRYQAPEPEPEQRPFTPDGQASVLDHATEEEGKEFYTFVTPEENIFYLVIDRQRESENVYFLNAVTENDLLELAEKSKQEAIKEAFQNWIFKDPDRRTDLCATYNRMFNSMRPREYDGQHINFIGMNPEIHMERHQRNAVARSLYGGNSLLAHVVGAGKTFEMVATAMESKRLGLCKKSMIVVPNHLTEQWGGDFMALYPGANVLVATKKDFEPKNRKKFCARIATGDYDAVIIGHSQFEKIPISPERQKAIIEEQIREIVDAIAEAKANKDEKFTIKQMERTKKDTRRRRRGFWNCSGNLPACERMGTGEIDLPVPAFFISKYRR